MIDEAIASAELAQSAWTYPICVACGAHILAESECWHVAAGPCHFTGCPATEDLSALPLVERAAIACSIAACRGDVVNVDDFADADAASLARKAWFAMFAGGLHPIQEAWAIAEAMLRTGEVQP